MNDQAVPSWKRYFYHLIAAEISTFCRYYDSLIQCERVAGDTGYLLSAVNCPEKQLIVSAEELPDLRGEEARRTAILLNGTLNHHLDIQALFTVVERRMSRTSRMVVIAFNPYLSLLYHLASRLGIRSGADPSTFVTLVDLRNLARLSGLEIVRARYAVYSPWRMLGLGSLVNLLFPLIPLLRLFGFVSIVVLRPTRRAEQHRPSLTVVVPARNEAGNIAAIVERLPDFGAPTELLFVEGHSTDGTWEQIRRVEAEWPHSRSRVSVRALQQTGTGKSDAIRLGFSEAKGELLTILDADMTTPPELLGRFYEAYRQGLADFINGSRLVYPMEQQAMLWLNRLGNALFAKILSRVLETRLGDTLCGTKLLARHDYVRVKTWRKHFGDFDPFGDFELIFPAAILGLGIVDVPIPYRARTYGATNIQRFRHGLMLLKMTLIGLLRVRMGRLPDSLDRG